MKPIEYHLEASWEADDAAAYYHGDDPEASSRFLRALGDIVSDIQAAPQRWPFEKGPSLREDWSRDFLTSFFISMSPIKFSFWRLPTPAADRVIGRNASRLINRALSRKLGAPHD